MAGRDGDGPEGKLGSGTCYWALACIHVYTRIEPSMAVHVAAYSLHVPCVFLVLGELEK